MRRRLAAVVPDVVGLVGLGLAVRGAYELWGRSWAMFFSGCVLAGVYVWREVRTVKRGRA